MVTALTSLVMVVSSMLTKGTNCMPMRDSRMTLPCALKNLTVSIEFTATNARCWSISSHYYGLLLKVL